MNNWSGLGRLVKDPDVRYTSGDNAMCVARYTLAADRRFRRDGQPNADFIPCVAMGKNGEFAEKYLHKGTKIAVTGHIQTGSYTNKEGNKVYTTDVIIDSQEFAESKATAQQNAEPTHNTAKQATAQTQTTADGFMNIPDGLENEELPFH